MISSTPRKPLSLPFLAALAAVLALGVWLRVSGIGAVALFGDEYHKHAVGEVSVGKILTSFDLVGSHILVPLLQHASLATFGPGVVSFRLVALIPGILTLLLFFPFARRMFGGGEGSNAPALLATLALAVHPMHVYYTRFGRGYALMLFLELMLLWVLTSIHDVEGVQEEGRGVWKRWVLAGLLAALLPIVHLSSAAVVLALGCASVLLAWRRGGPRSAGVPIAVFSVAAVLALLAFVPVLDDVRAYFAQTRELKDHPSTIAGVPILLAAGIVPAGLWAFGLPFFFAIFARKRPAAAVSLSAALAGPLVVLLVTRPHGMEYAWARYLLIFVPLVPLLLSWGILGALRRSRGVVAERIGLCVGSAALLVLFWTGPLGPTRPRVEAISNSYLAMRDLPSFDAPWSGASPFYGELASDPKVTRVVEFPVPVTRAALLFRTLGLMHGKSVRLGWPGRLPGALAGDGPYVNVLGLESEDADCVIVHRNLPREVRSYWSSVYGRHFGGVNAGFLLRHEATFIGSQGHVQPAFVAERAAQIESRFGPPSYEDEDVIVWRLRR